MFLFFMNSFILYYVLAYYIALCILFWSSLMKMYMC